jgi:hypothetical protein
MLPVPYSRYMASHEMAQGILGNKKGLIMQILGLSLSS